MRSQEPAFPDVVSLSSERRPPAARSTRPSLEPITGLAEELHRTLRRLLNENQPLFEAMWQRLTVPQRGALRAAVLEDGRELLGADARARHRLGGASTVQAALAALVRDDVLAREGPRYIVVDSLLREWVARRTF